MNDQLNFSAIGWKKKVLKSERFLKEMNAVVRCLEIIGEAAGRIPASLQAKYPGLPWREMTGMRHVLIHDYMGVNYRVVWKTVREDLPPLLPQLAKMIAENS